MPVVLRMTDEGTTEIVRKEFFDAGERARNLFPVLARISQDAMHVEAKLFYSQGRRGGGSWKQLAPSTVRQKGSSAILIDTQDLLRSLSRPGAEYQILDFTEDSFELGTDRPWAYTHQEGRGVPKREFLQFTEGDLTKWQRWIVEYLTAPFHEGETSFDE
jgi:hypothetical protein